MPYLSTNVLDGLFTMDPMQLANWGIAGGLASQGPSIGFNMGATLNAQAEMQAAQMEAIKANIRDSQIANRQKQRLEEYKATVDQLKQEYVDLLQLSKEDPRVNSEVTKARDAWLSAMREHRKNNRPRRRN